MGGFERVIATQENGVRPDIGLLSLGDCPNFRGHHCAAMVGENGTVPFDRQLCAGKNSCRSDPRIEAKL